MMGLGEEGAVVQVPDVKVCRSCPPVKRFFHNLAIAIHWCPVRIRAKLCPDLFFNTFQINVSQVKVSGLVRTKNDIVVEQVMRLHHSLIL